VNKKTEAAEKTAGEDAKQAAKEESKEEVKEDAEKKVVAKLYVGMVKLMIVSPVDYNQMMKLGEYVGQVQNLRLVLVGGSAKEGTKIVVSAEKPIPLVSVLREMPPVEQVVEKEKGIQVTLKANLFV